jgi:osmotically-inducible protein OsmY
MKRSYMTIASLAAAVVLAACAGTAHDPSTGETLDDTVITTKIKSAMLTDKQVSATDISVTTVKGRVLLSGYAKSPDERQRAEGIARETPGVKEVSNKIEVR